MDPNRDFYQRTVFSILDLFGTIGGIFGLLTAACGFIIGFVSTQIMLSSVFRRLYYTNKSSPDVIEMNLLTSKDHNFDSKYEENKEENKVQYFYFTINYNKLKLQIIKIWTYIKI